MRRVWYEDGREGTVTASSMAFALVFYLDVDSPRYGREDCSSKIEWERCICAAKVQRQGIQRLGAYGIVSFCT